MSPCVIPKAPCRGDIGKRKLPARKWRDFTEKESAVSAGDVAAHQRRRAAAWIELIQVFAVSCSVCDLLAIPAAQLALFFKTWAIVGAWAVKEVLAVHAVLVVPTAGVQVIVWPSMSVALMPKPSVATITPAVTVALAISLVALNTGMPPRPECR